jgi:hypothetical protein
MTLYRDHALVLRTYKLGEADRIVVLLTQDHGKVRTVAKGVRKTTSRHGARLEPIAHVRVQLYRGRELDTVTQVETVDSFSAIRHDLDRLGRAAILLEAIEAVTLEREPDPRLFALLLGGLRTLEAADRPLLVAGPGRPCPRAGSSSSGGCSGGGWGPRSTSRRRPRPRPSSGWPSGPWSGTSSGGCGPRPSTSSGAG